MDSYSLIVSVDPKSDTNLTNLVLAIRVICAIRVENLDLLSLGE